jgi:hypothetical protein
MKVSGRREKSTESESIIMRMAISIRDNEIEAKSVDKGH